MGTWHGEIGLVAEDEALVAFYRDVFGLPQHEPRSLAIGTEHQLGPDPGFLKILVTDRARRKAPRTEGEFWAESGLRYFTLWVDDVSELAQPVRDHGGVVTDGPHEDRDGAWSMFVRDPEGNLLEVLEEA